jgi:methylated-DNA-[protein]-cysteine S-methyltransferase
MLQYRLIDSPFGHFALIWREQGSVSRVVRILLPTPGAPQPQGLHAYLSGGGCCRPGDVHPDVDALCRSMARFLRGEPAALPIDLLDATVCTPFQWRVLMAEKAIPRGEVRTYGQIAAQVGCPRGARAVGNALANNPFPIVIPCHRAVRSDGSLGGFQGGVEIKRALLEMEGVRFDEKGQIVNGRDVPPGGEW